ncbi:hypothetical protein PPERSA_09169 [Pseudocohnilembus persalinus]|uniref:Malectin domain-containing protein n=1 Tax=Pseudocohnilembus persalinus TaxID=266149 RepID=A0A0V0QWS5_PSEPJ|nr:hypothetical protein PPERSA_09169 [Pseudocohnilembus persalinus]|eukprot:KRX06767.1 hypothetical protein PPERSA_09169 [Pseudocohnilembus persalinus]
MILKLHTLIFVLFLLSQTQSKNLKYADIVYAIDIGNTNQYESIDGVVYSQDKYYSEFSRAVDYSKDENYSKIPIKFTDDIHLYHTERHYDDTFQYKLPFKDQDDGTYVLISKFCELYFQEPKKRIINLKIGDQLIYEVDIVAEVGPFAALDKFIEFEYKNGKVYYQGKQVRNALNSKGELVVSFEKTKYDLPKVDGLLLLKGNLSESYQNEYNQTVIDWHERIEEEKKLKEAEKRKREKARSILLEEFDSQIDTNSKIGFLQGMIILSTEPIGFLIILNLALFFVCLKITEKSENKRLAQQDKQKTE